MAQLLEYKRDDDGALMLRLPVWPGRLLWYIDEGVICSARVYEIKYTFSDRGSCLEDFVAFAWNGRDHKNLTWCSIHQEGWLETRDSYVPVYMTRAEAVKAMEEKENEQQFEREN